MNVRLFQRSPMWKPYPLLGLAAMTFSASEQAVASQPLLDISDATVVVAGEQSDAEKIAATVLAEEVARRTGITWPVVSEPSASPEKMIRLALVGDGGGAEALAPESFRLSVAADGGSVVVDIAGADRRGLLYGVGSLLSRMHWSPGSVRVPTALNVTASPAYPLRGIQLRYEPLNNTYDAWDEAQYDRYIRELVLSASINAVENMPWFEFNKRAPGPDPEMWHMKVPPAEMNVAMSRMCERYGIDYWIYSAVKFDLNDSTQRTAALDENEAAFRDCPVVSNVFVPGGDPGHNHPRLLMPYLEELAERLTWHHPDAGIWVSFQKFNREKADYAFEYLREHEPTWLRGAVIAPWGPTMQEFRERLPEQYLLRYFPDMTHNVRCQHPVPWWDPALHLTLGREAPNPRPVEFAAIHNRFTRHTEGFIAYSEGLNDNINAVIWGGRGWDPGADVRDILVAYSRLFFGADVAERAADGILALEQNWRGPLALNGGVEATLALWRRLDEESPHLRDDWRWQLCLLRAKYDAFVRRRVIREERLEAQAMLLLAEAPTRGADVVMDDARAILEQADEGRSEPELRSAIESLCDDLWETMGMQTSVERHHALGPERGAILDFLDLPLNNRWWLEDEFQEIRAMNSAEEKLARLDVLRTWEDPGPGSFYDDVGNVAKSPHVLRGESPVTDPALERTPNPFFMWWEDGRSRARHSWLSDVHWPLGIAYRNLDTDAKYVLRMTGRGEILPRANGTALTATTTSADTGEFRLYPVPGELIRDGDLTVTFDNPDEGNIHWREWSRVNEVWLLRR